VAGQGDPAGFDLAAVHPAAIENLQAEFAKVELVAGAGVSGTATALNFAEFAPLGHQRHS
jgi:hypothetical protein